MDEVSLERIVARVNLLAVFDRLLVGARVEGDAVVLKTNSNVAARELLAGCQAREEHYRATLEMFLMPMPDKSTTVMDLLLAVTESAMEALALTADNTALKEALKQAKRDALLEAADAMEAGAFETPFGLRRMAGEIK
jgi:hypothetical protein